MVKASLSYSFIKALEGDVAACMDRPLVKMVILRQIIGRATWAFGLVPMLRPVLALHWAVLAEMAADAERIDSKQKPVHCKVVGREAAVQVTRILPELLWIRAIMRRAIGRGDLSRSVDARIYGAGHSIRITTDASPWGIGATLEQDGEFVAYLYDDIQDDDIKRLKITVGSSSAQGTCEALALLVAIRTWLPCWSEGRTKATTRSDSLSALGEFEKGSSASAAVKPHRPRGGPGRRIQPVRDRHLLARIGQRQHLRGSPVEDPRAGRHAHDTQHPTPTGSRTVSCGAEEPSMVGGRAHGGDPRRATP